MTLVLTRGAVYEKALAAGRGTTIDLAR